MHVFSPGWKSKFKVSSLDENMCCATWDELKEKCIMPSCISHHLQGSRKKRSIFLLNVGQRCYTHICVISWRFHPGPRISNWVLDWGEIFPIRYLYIMDNLDRSNCFASNLTEFPSNFSKIVCFDQPVSYCLLHFGWSIILWAKSDIRPSMLRRKHSMVIHGHSWIMYTRNLNFNFEGVRGIEAHWSACHFNEEV